MLNKIFDIYLFEIIHGKTYVSHVSIKFRFGIKYRELTRISVFIS